MSASETASAIATWLIGLESRGCEPGALVTALCEKLGEHTPLDRLSLSIRTKHPEVWVLNVEWTPSGGVAVRERRYAFVAGEIYAASPAEAIHRGEDSIRGKLGAGDTRFALYDELRASGLNDYFVIALPGGDGERTWASFATRGDFTSEHVAIFEGLRTALACRLELAAAHHTTRSLLGVYLGENAATRVLSGAFLRGSGDLVRAAIFFSDMRGFTTFADRRAPGEVVATLDQFFEAVGGHIHDAGGEILKFIGDAVLAVFRVGDDASERAVCQRALRAAERSLVAIDAINAKRTEPVHLGVALHFGDVMYGNIGAKDRLDFTVIGAAVNEASRLEGLCKVVGTSLLASRTFVDTLGDTSRMEPAGEHAVKGVGSAMEVFKLRG